MCRPDINTLCLLSCNHFSFFLSDYLGLFVAVFFVSSALGNDSSPAFLTHICGNVLQMLHSAAPSLPFAREVKFACQLPERSCLRVNRGSWCLFKVSCSPSRQCRGTDICEWCAFLLPDLLKRQNTVSGFFFIKSSMAV